MNAKRAIDIKNPTSIERVTSDEATIPHERVISLQATNTEERAIACMATKQSKRVRWI